MTRISSGFTWFQKRVFPIIWFGILACVSIAVASEHDSQRWVVIAIMVLMAGFGYVLMKKLLWVLVDEVYDCGDTLLVRQGGEEDRILISSIMNVSMSVAVNPSHITLRLRHQSKFGNEIAFMPISEFTLNPFAKNKVAENLMVRVDQARSGRVV